jgi:hypothetical protein
MLDGDETTRHSWKIKRCPTSNPIFDADAQMYTHGSQQGMDGRCVIEPSPCGHVKVKLKGCTGMELSNNISLQNEMLPGRISSCHHVLHRIFDSCWDKDIFSLVKEHLLLNYPFECNRTAGGGKITLNRLTRSDLQDSNLQTHSVVCGNLN